MVRNLVLNFRCGLYGWVDWYPIKMPLCGPQLTSWVELSWVGQLVQGVAKSKYIFWDQKIFGAHLNRQSIALSSLFETFPGVGWGGESLDIAFLMYIKSSTFVPLDSLCLLIMVLQKKISTLREVYKWSIWLLHCILQVYSVYWKNIPPCLVSTKLDRLFVCKLGF